MQIPVKINSNASKVLARFRQFPDSLLEGLAVEMNKQNRLTANYVARTRLSFPKKSHPGMAGLRVQTGTLRRGLLQGVIPAYRSGTGITAAITNNVRYANIHEFGFDGVESVPSFTRHQHSRDVMKGKKLKATGVAFVHGFMRHMHMPARGPVTHGLIERIPDYKRGFAAVVNKTFRGER